MASAGGAFHECLYCGTPIKTGRTCPTHRDLETLDAAELARQAPATDTEQGASTPYKVPRRAGRGELY